MASCSGRVVVQPLAFWANEVIPRGADGGYVGGYVADGGLPCQSVVDFTATFESERTLL